ncbi:MAG: hypothetical protein FJZ90_04970 [Chloroflexi bacterium]|nr:hypothetical protein [Chloroflexota bacterium]
MIRPFGLRDILTLRQLGPQGVAFDLERLLLGAPSPTQSALLGYLTRHRLGSITCVREDADGVGEGFVQVNPRADGVEWHLAFLSPALEDNGTAPHLWRQLLGHLIVSGTQQQVSRIYARCAEDAYVEDTLRQVGFTLLTREEVFRLSHPSSPASAPKGLREAGPQDIPALNQLYREVEPQLAQQAEGASAHWQSEPRLPLMYPISTCGYVWEEGGRVLAFLGVTSSSRGCWLQILVRPEHRGDLLSHIKYVLGTTGCSCDRPVYCPVPDRCVGLGWLLRAAGFEPYARQASLVVHTVVRVPLKRRLVVAGLEGSVDVGTPVGHIFQR